MRKVIPINVRFEAKVQRGGDCWLWTGCICKATGYGMISAYSPKHGYVRPTTAHRIAYELYVGDIPAGLVIDHLCRIRECVNPAHLEAVPQSINMLRGQHQSAISTRLNQCKRGHEFTPSNTRLSRTGRRDCRACMRIRGQLRRGSSPAEVRREVI